MSEEMHKKDASEPADNGAAPAQLGGKYKCLALTLAAASFILDQGSKWLVLEKILSTISTDGSDVLF